MLLNAKNYFWVLLVFCIVLLFLPLFIRDRYNGGLLVGSESYKSLRFGKEIKESGLISYDKLSYGGKPFVEEKGWYALLSINPEFMVKLLPFIFGILSFIVFYFLVAKIKPELKGISSLLLVLSPSFLYLFSVATKYTVAIFFILLGFYLISIKKNWLAYIAFLISGFFSILSLLFSILLLLFLALKNRKFRDFYSVLICFIFVFVVQFHNIFSLGLPESVFLLNNFTFSNFFSFIILGLGGKYGVGFFVLVLALIGIYNYYREKYKFLFFYALLFLLLFISFYLTFLFSYISFLLAFFAAIGLIPFLYGNWKSGLLKFLTLLVIFCGLLFSVLVFYDRVNSFEPSPEFFGAISFLKEQQTNSFVLSDYRNGEYITYAGKSSFLDNNYFYAPNFTARMNIANFLFNTTDIDTAVSTLNNNNISYILIDSKMREEIFDNRDERFLFLLKYSPNIFAKVYNNTEVELWHNLNATFV